MANLIVQTRQKADLLFPPSPPPATVQTALGVTPAPTTPLTPPNPSAVPSSVNPLGANGSIGFGPAEIDGYSAISVLIISDQPFTATFFEAIFPTGPFPMTQQLVANLLGNFYVVATRFASVGMYLKATIANTSSTRETVLSVEVLGVPAS